METVYMLDAAYEDVEKWLSSNKITKEVYQQIIQVKFSESSKIKKFQAKDLRKQGGQLQAVIFEKENEIRDIKDTQERLRKNITALADNSSEQKKYVQGTFGVNKK